MQRRQRRKREAISERQPKAGSYKVGPARRFRLNHEEHEPHGAAYGRNQNLRKKTGFEQVVVRRNEITELRNTLRALLREDSPHNHQSKIINNQSKVPRPTDLDSQSSSRHNCPWCGWRATALRGTSSVSEQPLEIMDGERVCRKHSICAGTQSEDDLDFSRS